MISETSPTPTDPRKPMRWPLLLVGLIPGLALVALLYSYGDTISYDTLGIAYLVDLILGIIALTRRGFRWLGVGLLVGAIPGVLGHGLYLLFVWTCLGPNSHCVVF